MVAAAELRLVSQLVRAEDCVRCSFQDGTTVDVPPFLGRFLQLHDGLAFLSATNADVLIERRPRSRGRSQHLLFTSIGYVSQPKPNANAGFFVRAELPNCTDKPKSLFLSAAALRSYFYLLSQDDRPSLYGLLQVPDSASPADLRLAWRVRSLELNARSGEARERAQVERAFNVLAHPDLRNCYDALRRDEDAPPLFPYGGFGSILVDGRLSENGEAFFADRILAYRPEMTSRKLTLLLRQCEFFTDRLICRDPRRKIEVLLDANLLPGLNWDLTWNHWKHWLKTRIEVEAMLVHAGKYRLRNGEWVLRKWYAALPSRLRIHVPGSLAVDIEQAQAIHSLLGQHAELVRHIQQQIEKQPIEHTQIQEWFDQLHASAHLKPQHVTWRPDYEPYYFEQLRKRSRTWFLFRDEYLFAWRHVLIAELPQPGHATYVFAKPDNVDAFLRKYSSVTREDIRHNQQNCARELAFVGRVVRGGRKKRWLADVLKHAGEKADYVEAFN